MDNNSLSHTTLVEMNDIYFNQNTVVLLDDRAREIIRQIDQSDMLSSFAISSRFDGIRTKFLISVSAAITRWM